MKFDTDLAGKVLGHIRADPQSWDQSDWRSDCGTKFCFAGWAAVLDDVLVAPPALVEQARAISPRLLGSRVFDYVLDDGSSYTLEQVLAIDHAITHSMRLQLADLLVSCGPWPDKDGMLDQGVSHIAEWAPRRLALGDPQSALRVEELFEGQLELDDVEALVAELAAEAAEEVPAP